VTSTVYDSAGRVWKVTDPRALESRTTYDLMGRTVKTIENYADGTVSDADDKTTEYAYGPAGRTSLTAKLTGGGGQTTEWVYGVTQSGGSGIDSYDLVGATKWPDPSTGSASSGQQESTTVNALGQTLVTTDRNGTVHTLTYDVLGRVTADAVTTLGSGVDASVRRVETAYDGQGNPYLVTTYDAASSGSIVTQVQRAFNGLGQLTQEWQSHSGAVNTTTTPSAQYAFSTLDSSNRSRLTSVTYPSGYVLTHNYASGINNDVSRLSSLSDASGTVESYDYLGTSTVVKRAHPLSGVDLTYIKQSGESNADAGDQYIGLDRFGRVADQRWRASGSDVDRTQYAHDRDGNRTAKTNTVNSAYSEAYTYDGLNQLSTFDRNSGARTQSWDYDAAGNWDSLTTNGGSPQTRTHNRQNEVTAVSGATTPTFDANGNMTRRASSTCTTPGTGSRW
jgi:YD repeat-containing protein